MKETIAVVRCSDYSQSFEAILSALAQLELPLLFRSCRVLFKVNLMKGAQPEEAVNTHPDFVAALVRIVRREGGEALVGDSSGILGCTDEAFEASGIADAVRREGGALVNFDACELVRVPVNGRVMKEAWIPRLLNEVDLVVSVPKLKTHTILLMTCAVKNLVGVLAGALKCRLHEIAPSPEDLAHAILDLSSVLPVRLAIVDGVGGLGGQGIRTPAEPRDPRLRVARFGGRRKVGVVVAGRSLVSVDAVCAHLIGIHPDEVLTCRFGEERGFGTCDISRLEIRGEQVDSLRQAFSRPGFEPKRIPLYGRIYYHVRGNSVKPRVERNNCKRCGHCAEVCPTTAISLTPYPTIADGCILCFRCHECCPHGAMRLKCHPLLRRSFAARAGATDVSKLW